MVLVFCGCRSDWLCTTCAKCATCCACEGTPHLVHSNSGEGAHALASETRKRRDAERAAR